MPPDDPEDAADVAAARAALAEPEPTVPWDTARRSLLTRAARFRTAVAGCFAALGATLRRLAE